jgi:hypothetical protein
MGSHLQERSLGAGSAYIPSVIDQDEDLEGMLRIRAGQVTLDVP